MKFGFGLEINKLGRIIYMKPKWIANKQYPNTRFAIVNNEEEYSYLAKDLFRKHDVVQSFSCDQWTEKIHLFNDDYFSWHEFFETGAVDYNSEEYNEDAELPNPKKYNGKINNKPIKEEYPVVVIFDGDLMNIMWQSLKEL